MVKKWLRVILTSVCMMIGTTAFAYVDDAGIMGQFNYDNSMNMWQYLNDNGFQFKPDRYRSNPGVDGYIKNDHSMFISIINKDRFHLLQPGQLVKVIILKPGVSTDKGIQVGSSVSDVINSYGKVYKKIEQDVYKNEPNTGWYGSELYRGAYPNDVKYYLLCYQDEQSHTIQFIINASSKKVSAIEYWWWGDMHDDGTFASPLYYCCRSGGTMDYYLLWHYVN